MQILHFIWRHLLQLCHRCLSLITFTIQDGYQFTSVTCNNSAVHVLTYEEFMKGHFATQTSGHKFSALPHDQIHEQLNAMVKGDGGLLGLTENDSALKRWMVAGREISKILREYDDVESSKKQTSDCHHEQIPSIQMAFLTDVKHVVDVMEDMGNPFQEESTDISALIPKPSCQQI